MVLHSTTGERIMDRKKGAGIMNTLILGSVLLIFVLSGCTQESISDLEAQCLNRGGVFNDLTDECVLSTEPAHFPEPYPEPYFEEPDIEEPEFDIGYDLDCSVKAYLFESKEIGEKYIKDNTFSSWEYLGKVNVPEGHAFWASLCWNDPLEFTLKEAEKK